MKNKNKTSSSENINKLVLIPNIGPKLRQEFKKVDQNLALRSGENFA